MLQETIAAIATAPGEAGISVIRVSGREACQILSKVFFPIKKDSFAPLKPRYLYLGDVKDKEGVMIDQALAVYMPAPNSYTGEDVVEIQCHGGYVVTKAILQALFDFGAVPAEPGEFTQRAFLNGKLNLTQAEAIIDIIQAKSKEALKISERQLKGALGKQVLAEADQLLDILAQIEVAVDYPEEEGDIWQQLQLEETLQAVLHQINKLLAGAEQGKYYKEGILTAIVGPANAGKSTLLNAFLEEERAIVTEIAGTTRDTVEEFYTIRGVPLRLVDTAGIRETEDIVEAKGIARSKEKLQEADLVLAVFDSREPIPKEWQEILQEIKEKPTILLGNKIDGRENKAKDVTKDWKKMFPWTECFLISAKESIGIEPLKEKMIQKILGDGIQNNDLPGLVNQRQRLALQRAAEHLQDAISAYRAGIDGDMLSVDIQGAWQALGEITGSVCADDIITRVFSRFCLGK